MAEKARRRLNAGRTAATHVGRATRGVTFDTGYP